MAKYCTRGNSTSMAGYWLVIRCNFQSEQMVCIGRREYTLSKQLPAAATLKLLRNITRKQKKKHNFIWDGILTFIVNNLNYKDCNLPTISTEYATSTACRVSHPDGPTTLRHYKYTRKKDVIPHSLYVMHWWQHMACAETCSQNKSSWCWQETGALLLLSRRKGKLQLKSEKFNFYIKESTPLTITKVNL